MTITTTTSTSVHNYYHKEASLAFPNSETAGFYSNRHRFSRTHLPLPIFDRRKLSMVRSSRSSLHCCIINDACCTECDNDDDDDDDNGDAVSRVRIVALVGEGSISPLKSTPWFDVMLQTFEMLVFTDNTHRANDKTTRQLQKAIGNANFLVIVAVINQESVKWIQTHCRDVPNIVCFDSSPALTNKFGGSLVQTKSIYSILPLPQSKKNKESNKVIQSVFEAWNRGNSNDIQFCLLVIINAYIKPVPVLKNLRAKGFFTLKCMLKNCGPQILNCIMDPNCRKALQCLNKCSPSDKICSYRCLLSYESPILKEFSLCILQKNNCLELDAEIAHKPQISPLAQFRGENLSHEIAEDLLVGWLGNLDWSWQIVATYNPFDQFLFQYMLFYRGKAKGSFWYEPVFQIRMLDGDLAWRRKKYRVKRGKIPGTFNFTVLDNGVVSNEFWTIVDVCDDLSWGLFHYHGVVRFAGQTYTGAVLVSPDGAHPAKKHSRRLASALDKCSIKDWELFDNCSVTNPPLGLPEGSSLHCHIRVDDFKGSTV